MIFRRRRVRIEIEESTLTLRVAESSASSAPVDTTVPPVAPQALPQPKTDTISGAENAPKSIPEGSRHVQ